MTLTTVAPRLVHRRSGGPREFRYTREDYEALAESGVFANVRVELIRGRLIEMPPIGEDHSSSSLVSADVFRDVFPRDRFTVRPGLPFIACDDSMPEPDLCIVEGNVRSTKSHPRTCVLLVEVSESTLAFDRGERASVYAESGVADYWIINLVDRVVEVYRNPARRDDGTWGYDAPIFRGLGETVAPLARPDAAIGVAELLPA